MISIAKHWTVGLLAVTLLATPALAEEVKVDAKIPVYAKVQGVSGNLNSIGSDTLNNLMTFWAEGFRKSTPTSTSRSRARAPAPRRRP